MIRRREFITFLGGAAAWPLAARAQQPALPLIGYLSSGSQAVSGERLRMFLRGLNEAGYSDNHPHTAADQVGCKLRESIVLPFRPAIFDGDILAFAEAGLAQTLKEHPQALAGYPLRSAAEIPDHWHRRLLRAHRERPCRRATEKRDESASPNHSITSSARAISVRGRLMPKAFAVLRLMINCTLLAC